MTRKARAKRVDTKDYPGCVDPAAHG
jgi:hypothetical protein